ncbi:hypothetical protein Phum_PHUM473330 [Pediculus humanus corporis]|uniref:Uncharacterized protein n=1 Tax=Pediculus humanus subsp. corporis TaxID=121224 RepID=E0VW34_PEDHC|nr:uncharacterized protein Phum_PHUM473330 [Pediculus humanus corporis]EEB17590.1 hypothetical protein Phum_PHUM473330 [Pediculus humanus corporis]
MNLRVSDEKEELQVGGLQRTAVNSRAYATGPFREATFFLLLPLRATVEDSNSLGPRAFSRHVLMENPSFDSSGKTLQERISSKTLKKHIPRREAVHKSLSTVVLEMLVSSAIPYALHRRFPARTVFMTSESVVTGHPQ